jgi:ribosomal protein S18 acetylase RimI-like enzyme
MVAAGNHSSTHMEETVTYINRPIRLPADLAPLAELSTRSEALDELDFPASVEGLTAILDRPTERLEREARVWEDATGRMVGFGLLNLTRSETQLDGMLWMRFAPEARVDALFGEVFAWGREALETLGGEAGLPVVLYSGTGNVDTWRVAQLEAHGLRPIRYFWRMERDLTEPLPAAQLPAGYTLRPVEAHEADAWTALYNDSFIDHWDHHPLSVERVRRIWQEPLYRRDLDLVIVAPEGELVAFCGGERNAADPDRAGWIEILGTRRGYRGRGLGKAALLFGLERLRADGAQVARLIVDAESLTGATRLYEGVGFQVTRRSTRYSSAV